MIIKKILPLSLILSCFISLSLKADQERHIHLNGEHLNDETIVMMDQVFGVQVYDGFYWLNQQTGEWGYENDSAVQGVISSVNQYQQEQEAPQEAQSSGNARRGEYSSSQNGSAYIGGEGECSYVSAGGMSFRSCD